MHVGDLLLQLPGSLLPPSLKATNAQLPPEEKKPHPLRARREAIVWKAYLILGCEKKLMQWLSEPKVALKHRAPVEMLGNMDECDAVDLFLSDLWQWLLPQGSSLER